MSSEETREKSDENVFGEAAAEEEKEMTKDKKKIYVFKNFDWMTRQEEEAFRKEAQERGQTVLNVFTVPRPPLYDSTGSVQGYYDERGTIRPYTYE